MHQKKINAETAVYAVIGSPIKHSKSPAIYNSAFSRDGLNNVYVAFEVSQTQTQQKIEALKLLGVKGINITMPCKHEALVCADELDDAAKYVQAVNTLVFEDDRWKGYNTDGIGFWAAVKTKGYHLKQQRVMIFGSGNTAAILMVQAVLEGVSDIYMVARDLERPLVIKEVIAKLTTDYAVNIKLLDLTDTQALQQALLQSEIVVQATSVGMAPAWQENILPAGLVFKQGALVSDCVYNPLQTEFLKVAEAQGCVILHGLHMLVGQAAENYRLFTACELDVELLLAEI